MITPKGSFNQKGRYLTRFSLRSKDFRERRIKAMTKVDIVEAIYEKVGFSKKEVAKIVESIFDIMKNHLQHENKIKISGFGNFVVRNKRSRRGRNPQTGDDIEITPRRILTFKPSQVLKASLNRKETQETEAAPRSE